jgi:hypothetical protein
MNCIFERTVAMAPNVSSECQLQSAKATDRQSAERTDVGMYRRPEVVCLGSGTKLLQGKNYGVQGDYAGSYYTRIG